MPDLSQPGTLPPWLKVKLPQGDNFNRIREISKRRELHTVCEEARCPNIAECWGGGTATFMIMGDTCTRGCRFCSVSVAARPASLDLNEPSHLAETLAEMKLEYVVVTSVARDDLPDQGAGHTADCIRAIKNRCPSLLLEILIPDFQGKRDLLAQVIEARPDVISHNLETVERLSPRVRDTRAGYRQSLEVLRFCREMMPGKHTKSSLMLGLGETEEEVTDAFRDLRAIGVSILTLGQYLRPTTSKRHLPVMEFIPPERFKLYEDTARAMGFLYVAAGPFVRSSYRAGELFLKGLLKEKSMSEPCH